MYVGSYINFGTMHEGGIGRAHLAEHIVANSPPALAIPPVPSTAITFSSNALTKPNFTVFVRTVSPDALEASIYSRLVRIGRFKPDEALFQREKDRVVQELERGRASSFAAYKALEALMRGEPASLDAEIAEMRTISMNALMEEVRSGYIPSKAVLVITGNFDLAEGEALADKAVNALNLDRAGAADPPVLHPTSLTNIRQSRVIAQNATGSFSAGVGFRQPPHDSPSFSAFLILDQLLMGGRKVTDGTISVARSDQSPLGIRLVQALGATSLWDGKENRWGVSAFAEGDPSIYAIIFSLPGPVDPVRMVQSVQAAMKDVQAVDMKDSDIEAVRDELATFYEQWLFEPDYRILSDHLAAQAFAGRDVTEVKSLPQRIRATSAFEVRAMMDELLSQQPAAVLLKPPGR